MTGIYTFSFVFGEPNTYTAMIFLGKKNISPRVEVHFPKPKAGFEPASGIWCDALNGLYKHVYAGIDIRFAAAAAGF